MKTSKSFYNETRKRKFRVTVFGSARVKKTDKVYKEVFQLGKLLGEREIEIVTGGGPGLMNAVSVGHKTGKKMEGTHAIGLNIKIPNEQRINPNITLIKEFARFSKRLDNFMLLSNAIVVCPGGFGTLLELFYAWQLLQVEQIKNIPVILMGDMWQGLIKWMENHQLRKKYFEKKDLESVFIAHSPDEAIEIIDAAYKSYREGKNDFCSKHSKYKLE